MAVYRLQRFPAVCVHCLEPPKGQEAFISIQSYHDSLGCTIGQKTVELFGNMIGEGMGSEIAEMLPSHICQECLDTIIAFHQYQNDIRCVGRFSAGLAHLLCSNGAPLMELYGSQGRYLVQVLKSLKICRASDEEITLDRLVEELTDWAVSDRNCTESNCHDALNDLENESVRNDCKMELNVPDHKHHLKVQKLADKKKHTEQTVVSNQQARKRGRPGKTGDAMTLTKVPGRWKCKYEDICEKTFANEKSAKKHAREDHQSFPCSICGTVHQFYSHYRQHMERHIPSAYFVCDYCNVQYSTKRELIYHLKSVHIVNPTEECQCNVCGMVFRGRLHLQRHMKSHRTEREFVCPVCSKAFKTSTHLRRHSDIHQNLQYRCTMCDMTYARRDKMRAHLEVVHQIQSYFVCEICLATFDGEGLLQQHTARHQHPKMLECGVCLGVYLSEEDLAHHCCITYQDNYRCCGRDFRYHTFYNKHMMVAHGVKANVRVKPPKDRLLSQYRALRTPTKPLVSCERCDEQFDSKRALTKHRNSHCINSYDGSVTALESLSIELLTE